MSRLKPWQQAAYQLGLALVALFVLAPIWEMAYLAFDGGVIGWPTSFRLWPQHPTWAIFQQMWLRPGQSLSFLGALQNSLVVAGGAALLSVGLGASLAYAFARFRFPGRGAGLFGLLLGTMLPPVALMTPLYILLTALHMRVALLALVIVYASFSMPLCIWNMRAAFQAVPKELEESACLDGANAVTAFWRITLPLALPAIAVAALIAFLIAYSEFAMGWLFVEKSSDVTLAMAISGIFNGNDLSWSWLAALSVLMSLPVVAIFVVLQKYVLSGLLIGAPSD
jgi:arabinogalactan oligomer / maltooligosaccharide transport system permease protein